MSTLVLILMIAALATLVTFWPIAEKLETIGYPRWLAAIPVVAAALLIGGERLNEDGTPRVH